MHAWRCTNVHQSPSQCLLHSSHVPGRLHGASPIGSVIIVFRHHCPTMRVLFHLSSSSPCQIMTCCCYHARVSPVAHAPHACADAPLHDSISRELLEYLFPYIGRNPLLVNLVSRLVTSLTRACTFALWARALLQPSSPFSVLRLPIAIQIVSRV